MKKILTLFLVCLLLAMPLFTFIGCDNTPDDPKEPSTDNPSTDDPITPSSMINLVENGATEYRIIISDYNAATAQTQAVHLRNAIEAVTGVKLAIKTDWENKDNNADIKEILIGKTNRAESISIINDLLANEYTIVHSNNKIVIAGGMDEMLIAAVSRFISEYVGYNSENDYVSKNILALPENLNITESLDVSQNVALLVANESLTYVDNLYEALKAEINVVDLKSLTDDPTTVFNAKNYGTVIIAGAENITISAKNCIEGYMNDGGRILTLGGPAFENKLVEKNGKLSSFNEYLHEMVDDIDSDHISLLVDTSSPTIVNHLVQSSQGDISTNVVKVGNYGLEGSSRQLFHEVQSVSGWNNLVYLFSDGYELPVGIEEGVPAIGFYAKAMDDHTNSLYIEITDAKGSRWMDVVELSQEWEYKTLLATDFSWWRDSPRSDDTYPNFVGLRRILFGFSRTGQAVTSSHHSYCISDISMIALPELEVEMPLAIDSLYPTYELYPITNGDSLVTSSNQVFISDRDYVLSDNLISCHPGRQGLGFDNDRTSRFVPLIEVKDEKGLHSGYAAWMHIFSSTNRSKTDATINGDLEGAILACFSSVSEEFYNADGIAAIVETAKAITRNTFLVEGGTDEFIYVAGDTESIIAGASFVDLGIAKAENLTVTVSLYSNDTLVGEYSSETVKVKDAQNNISRISSIHDLSKGKPDRAVTTLMLDGEVIDMIEHTVKFWEPKPASDRHFIYIEDGQFKRDGEAITFFGVNYSPSYGMAEPNTNLFEYFDSAAAYDPVVVANDLARIKDLGMNAVSIFTYYKYMRDCNNILDIIQQCEDLGLYVNMSIRPTAYPLADYNEEQVETLLQRLHFYEIDTIIAYDIAWEPRIGAYNDTYTGSTASYIGRKGWDADWAEWVNVQYGSLAHAETLWGVKLSKTDEGYPYVSDSILNDQTGKYTKVVSAYYRFIDDQVARLFNEKMLHMQPLVPNQLITFRMSMSGSGLRASGYEPSTFCFDFQSLASTMAYMEPEGYHLSANDAYALQIAIANAYARYVQPDSPIVWKEFGQQSWTNFDNGNFNQDEDMLESVYDYYKSSLEYMLNSYTSGVYPWYYAGGYRYNENTDCGIFNPDGSDRGKITALLREYAPKFINQGARPEADIYIKVERDNQDGGIFGIYEATAEEARKAYDKGQFFEFVDANMDSTDDIVYADEVCKAAVGGTAEDGLYPLRYVNGMVKDFKVTTKDGKTYAEITVCNTKQSTWRANTVSLVSTDDSDIKIDYTFTEDVEYLENVTTVKFEIKGTGTVALRFEIEGIQFGPLYTTEVK